MNSIFYWSTHQKLKTSVKEVKRSIWKPAINGTINVDDISRENKIECESENENENGKKNTLPLLIKVFKISRFILIFIYLKFEELLLKYLSYFIFSYTFSTCKNYDVFEK